MRRLLLISNSTMHGREPLAHVLDDLRGFLGTVRELLFVPWALAEHDGYAARIRSALARIDVRVRPIHEAPNALAAVGSAAAVFVGGGNTFRLLDRLHTTGAAAAIAARARSGMPYIGSSAGTNVATPTIRTTNDMPIVAPPTLAAMALVPFQINPHYLDPDPASKHMGETREERLRQFHEVADTPVLGLREGGWLTVDGDTMLLRGSTAARLFVRGEAAREIPPATDLSFLLANRSR